MDPTTTACIEQFACASDLELDRFSAALSKKLGLPPMSYDFENESEWVSTSDWPMIVDLARRYDVDQLHAWYPHIPAGCNYSLTLVWPSDSPEGRVMQNDQGLLRKYATALSEICKGPVYHVRTWTKERGSVNQTGIYRSPPGS